MDLLGYDPSQDSSETCKPTAARSGELVLEIAVGTCLCGCMEKPSGAKAKFRMGHDARLRGKLLRAHLAGAPVRYVRSRVSDARSAMEWAERHGWGDYLRTAELRRSGKNREVLRRALKQREAGRLIKVGRWDKTGGQVTAVYRTSKGRKALVEYVTTMGEIKHRYVPVESVQTEENHG